MRRIPTIVADNIVLSCLDMYNKLPKTGKPVENEWTVLSCFVQYDTLSGDFEVVSLGTGSKCIGASKMSPQGDILNDSHAEVIARRGFLVYLYDNIDNALKYEDSVFSVHENNLKLKENIEFVFYSSQLPCGDASIIPKSGNKDHFGEVVSLKRSAEEDTCETESKRHKNNHRTFLQNYETELESKTHSPQNLKSSDSVQTTINQSNSSSITKSLNQSSDIHRTGAKCLPDSEQDPKQPGIDYHLLGKVRTKPGRGDRTLSVSCSDKMARWIHLGIQGALLDMLCGPIYFKHLIFGAGVPFSNDSLKRALVQRNLTSDKLNLLEGCLPEIYQSTVEFNCLKHEKNIRPAPGSIVWIKSHKTEVAVQGKKLGVTKKNLKSLNSLLCISKYKLYERFLNILRKNTELLGKHITCDIEAFPYNHFKRKSERYVEKWKVIKETLLGTWTVKPDIWSFTIGRN